MKSTIKMLLSESLLAIVVSACGGGGGGSSPSPAQTPVPAVKKPVTIDAQGDSTMYGYNGIGGQTPNNAPVVLQATLQAKFGASVTVVNNGVLGTTAPERMNGMAPYTQTFAQHIAADSSQIVIVNFGINDANPAIDESISTFQNYLLQFIATAQAAGKTVILEEPNPTCDNPARTVNLDKVVATIDAIASSGNIPLVSQYEYIKALPNWQGMMPDCIHPNDALYAIKASREAAVIGPIVEKMQ
jgi:lysophospholipase L1-like esterase